MAKRKAIAASIRNDAEKLAVADNHVPEMLRLMESLEYENDEATTQKVETMAAHYVQSLKDMPAEKVGAKKDEAKQVSNAFKFLAKFNVLPATFPPKVEIEGLIKEQHWDKK